MPSKYNQRGGSSSSSPKRDSGPASGVRNYTTRLKAAGLPVPEKEKEKKSTLGKLTFGALDYLSRPSNAVNVALKNATDHKKSTTIVQGLKDGITRKETYTGVDRMRDAGVTNKAAQFVGGTLTDIALDPTTYMTFGVGGLAKGAATGAKATMTGGTKTALQAAAKSDALTQAEKHLMVKYGDDAAKNAADIRLRKEAAKIAPGSVKAPRTFGMSDEKAGLVQAVTKSDVLKKGQYDQMLHNLAFQGDELATGSYKPAMQKHLDDASSQVESLMKHKAGPGVTAFGKTLVTGERMQEIGADIHTATRAIPGVGNVLKSADSTLGKMFKPYQLEGAEPGLEKAMSIYNNTMKGRQNFGNVSVMNKTNALKALLTNRMDKEGQPLMDTLSSAMSGSSLQREGAGAMRNPAFSRVDWKEPIVKTKEDLYAAKQLGLNIDSTMEDLAMAIKGDFNKALRTEQSIGRMGAGLKEDASTGLGYVPRNLTKEAKGARSKSGFGGGNIDVYNQFNRQRNSKFDGMNIEQINKQVADEYAAKGNKPTKLFETNIAAIYADRMLTNNRVLSSADTLNTALAALGTKLKGGTTGATQREIMEALERGDEIVAPASMLSNTDIVDDIIQKGIMPVRNLSKTEALKLSGSKNASVYIMPRGFSDQYNSKAAKQMNEGMQMLKGAFDKFNDIWKPLVTSMNVKFHTRNFFSGTFNNFIDLGVSMADPSVQRMARAVAGQAFSKDMEKTAIELGGKSYTAKEILALMHQNNAVSAFSSSDAAALKTASTEIDEMLKGRNLFQKANQAGRAVGNRTEEYVRAVNFVAHMKQGMSPMMAAEMTRTYQFDYTELSNFEQTIKTVLPFYTWVRKNVPLQIESFLNDPRAYSSLYKAQNNGSQVSGIAASDMPEYIRENMAIPFGKTAEGDVKIFDAGLPVSDLFTSARDLASMVSPVIKAPIELGMNQSMMTGQPIAKYDTAAVVNLLYKDQSPIAKVAQTVNKLSGGTLEKAMMENPDAVTAFNYAVGQTGILGNINRYGAATQTSSDQKTLKSQYDMYDSNMNPLVRAAAGVIDPRTGHIKYLNVDKAKTNKDWAYYDVLADFVQQYKDMGYRIPTVTEMKKKAKKKEWR